MFNSIPISCNQAKDFPRGRAMQARARRVLFANVIGPPLYCSPSVQTVFSLFSHLSSFIFTSFFLPIFSSSPTSSFSSHLLPFLLLPSLPSPLGKASVVVIVISYFSSHPCLCSLWTLTTKSIIICIF